MKAYIQITCIHIKMAIFTKMCVCIHTCISTKAMRKEVMNWKEIKEKYMEVLEEEQKGKEEKLLNNLNH